MRERCEAAGTQRWQGSPLRCAGRHCRCCHSPAPAAPQPPALPPAACATPPCHPPQAQSAPHLGGVVGVRGQRLKRVGGDAHGHSLVVQLCGGVDPQLVVGASHHLAAQSESGRCGAAAAATVMGGARRATAQLAFLPRALACNRPQRRSRWHPRAGAPRPAATSGWRRTCGVDGRTGGRAGAGRGAGV